MLHRKNKFKILILYASVYAFSFKKVFSFLILKDEAKYLGLILIFPYNLLSGRVFEIRLKFSKAL